ncbi:MAG TPA: RNA polymerase sigma factor [Candidatus Hydrogenedentes bacterium]|nr:RNA polymerase sigma factor [Candidatus Hydrogenedentota bacterium]
MQEPDQEHATWVREALDRYERPLVRYALRYAGDLESARDAVQDTFLQLCNADAKMLNGKLAGWLFTVCRNRALDNRRKTKRTVHLDETVESNLTCPMPQPGDAMDDDDARRMVYDEIELLEPAEREVILLKFHEGLTYREISQITGTPVATINHRMHALLTRIAARVHAKNAAP